MASNCDPNLGELDVLIVGAGFSGIYTLHKLRNLRLSVKVVETGADLGGVWYWNYYPGTKTDSCVPIYEFSMDELWKDWTWTEKYPRYAELRNYFQYVDFKLDLKKGIHFNTRITFAHYDAQSDRWTVGAENGMHARPRFLVLCTGFTAKEYIPPLKGLETFRGICHHTAKWPQEDDVSLAGKRVAVIGTGASGVQVIQEVGPIVKHLTVLQRTPIVAIPMVQTKLGEEWEKQKNKMYLTIFRRRLQTFDGMYISSFPKDFYSVSPEERQLYLEDLWNQGGYSFLSQNYQDILSNEQATNEVYEFWKEKVRERVHDPINQEILAPTKPSHPFGTKRPCLERTYYEVFNQSNVTLIDIGNNPITEITSEITSNGILTTDGVHHEIDVLVLATGFDAVTGPITQIDIRGVDGTTIKEKWADGVYTHLGMATTNFVIDQ